MARVNAAEFAKKWKERLDGSREMIKAGVERVKTAPGKSAAAKSDKYLAGVQRSVEEKRWQRGVEAVTLEDWQKSMIDKGLNRIASGTAGAQTKMERFGTALLAETDRLSAEVHKMPDVTIDDSIARATYFMRGMSKFNYKGTK